MSPSKMLYGYCRVNHLKFVKNQKFNLFVMDASKQVADAVFDLTYLEAIEASLLTETKSTMDHEEPRLLAKLMHNDKPVWMVDITPRKLAFLCTRFKNLHTYEDIDFNIVDLMENVSFPKKP